MKKLLLPLFFLPIVFSVQAQQYTPEQLNRMVNSGNFPEQGPSSSESKYMDFEQCVLTAKTVSDSIKDYYPTSVITDTSIAYIVKIWANDGVTLITCSKSDNKMVMTQSSYK